ncbi:hypothetical protein VCHA53O466_140125 [Vibrio chagasii]|nr:hypothetical protein VCHA53O466_140125 [Vibrio chagasii]
MSYRIKKCKKVISGDIKYYAQRSIFGLFWKDINGLGHEDPEVARKECISHQEKNDTHKVEVTYIGNLRGIK